MRIFISFLPSGNASVPNSQTWLHNLYEPLLDLGCNVYLVRIDETANLLKAKIGSITFKEKFSDYILKTFKLENEKQKFDLFLSYFHDKHIFSETIEEIKKTGVPTANFSCNNTHQFYLTQNIAPHYDFNLHSEKDAGEKFKKIGANPIWFQMAANPKYYHPVKTDLKYDVSFIGSSYAKRSEYVFSLLENNIDVHCFGPNWLINKPHPKLKKIHKEILRLFNFFDGILTLNAEKRFEISSKIKTYDFHCYLREKYSQYLHYPLSDLEMVRLYSQSKINLGFLEVFASDNAVHSFTQQHLHLREFEIPMSGGLYITNYSEELSEHYEPDVEVIVFNNEYELIEKVKYYTKNDKEADKIRRAGLERALESHTYQRRFQDLFNELGL
jgi:spore maturation protein CgeB